MLYSLSIDNLQVSTFGIIYFDGTTPVNLLDDIGAFPFGEEFACKESKTRVVQKNIFTNFQFPLFDSFILPSFNFFFKWFGIFIRLGSPFIK